MMWGVAVQFNEINSRKLGDQLNIFDGIWRNPVFLSVIAITLAFQVIIIQTPVSSVFHVQPQTWQEWLIAVGIGAGSTIACLLSKLLLRSAPVYPVSYTHLSQFPNFKYCSVLMLNHRASYLRRYLYWSYKIMYVIYRYDSCLHMKEFARRSTCAHKHTCRLRHCQSTGIAICHCT